MAALNYGIKISDEGYDALSAAEKNLSLKSGETLLKVYDEDSIDIVGTSKVIAHSLGYASQFLAWIYLEDGGIKDEGVGLATGDDTFGTAFMSTTALSLFSTGSLKARYYIFYEPLESGADPGNSPSSDYGIKVSKEGVDVKTAKILEQTFNTEKNCLKIASDDTDSQTVNTSYNFLIAHGLSVFPGYLVFFEVNNNGYWFSENETDTISGKNASVRAWTTATQLVVRADSSASCTVKIHYYIFADAGK